jgi:uncharacterized protein YraI
MTTSSCLRLAFGVYLLAVSAAAAAQNAVTTHPVSVYAGPDDSYPMVAQLDSDVPVEVMGCLDDWSWCDVTFEGNRGWLYAPDISYDYEGGYVPFYTYAPSFGIPVVQFTIGDYWSRYYHGRPWYAQRGEWEHRGLAHHRRPSGPPPSAGPPPRSARMDRPTREAQPERSTPLGNAERPRPDAERHDGAGDKGDARPRDARVPEGRAPGGRAPDGRSPDGRSPLGARPPEARAPEARSADHVAPSHESQATPAQRAAPPSHEEHPSGRAEPPRHEERAPAPRQAEGARPEAARHGDKPGDRPNDSPH